MAQALLFATAAKPDDDLVKTIRQGIPAYYFNQLKNALYLPTNEAAEILGISIRTLNRKRKDRAILSSEITEKILRTARIYLLARTIFTEDKAVAEWIKSPAPALNGAAPIEYFDTDVGARMVEALIQGIAYGNVI